MDNGAVLENSNTCITALHDVVQEIHEIYAVSNWNSEPCIYSMLIKYDPFIHLSHSGRSGTYPSSHRAKDGVLRGSQVYDASTG